jgi:hypothetical protein
MIDRFFFGHSPTNQPPLPQTPINYPLSSTNLLIRARSWSTSERTRFSFTSVCCLSLKKDQNSCPSFWHRKQRGNTPNTPPRSTTLWLTPTRTEPQLHYPTPFRRSSRLTRVLLLHRLPLPHPQNQSHPQNQPHPQSRHSHLNPGRPDLQLQLQLQLQLLSFRRRRQEAATAAAVAEEVKAVA